MDFNAELRYYEIRFTRLINQFFRVYKLDKMMAFIEMACFISEADVPYIKNAVQKILANDPKMSILRDEYIVTLKLFSGLNNKEIREVISCSPNTIVNAIEDYKNHNLYIQPKLDITTSDEVRKLMRSLIDISNIY